MRPRPSLPEPLLQQHTCQAERCGRFVDHDGQEDDEAQPGAGARGMRRPQCDSIRGGVDDETEGRGERALVRFLGV